MQSILAPAETVANWWRPEPVIEEHDGRLVVRDDLVPGGSKMRFLPYLVEGANELVFGGPFCGGAPYALSEWGAREGVKVTLFYAKRKQLHTRQKLALLNGAEIRQVPFGYMTNVQAKARAYAAEAGARFLPLGFDLPDASEPFIDHIRRVAKLVGPVDQVWCATGSGMLARCLGQGFRNAEVHGVAVGLASRHDKQYFNSNVQIHSAGVPFARESKAPAPFPTCRNYDRKAWVMCQERSAGRVLFWNVLG